MWVLVIFSWTAYTCFDISSGPLINVKSLWVIQIFHRQTGLCIYDLCVFCEQYEMYHSTAPGCKRLAKGQAMSSCKLLFNVSHKWNKNQPKILKPDQLENKPWPC